ncbi:MAG TPA: tetratricopeptide repeat protein [Chthoniobacteraceae bacterium]|jgi:tetratricopeptide (TPR) repeat protein
MRGISWALFWMLQIAGVQAIGAGFESANQLYEAGKFVEAREEYRQLLDGGQRTANLYYNLGNTEYRLGAPGLAILEYERALEADPSHPEAQANLKLLRGQTGARVRAEDWGDRHFPRWGNSVYVVALTVSVWAGLFALAALVGRSARGAPLVFAAVAFGIAIYFAAGIWRHERRQPRAIITAEVEARLAPAESAGPAGSLPVGSEVWILSERGDWAYCELPDATNRGWINLKALERVRPKAA